MKRDRRLVSSYSCQGIGYGESWPSQRLGIRAKERYLIVPIGRSWNSPVRKTSNEATWTVSEKWTVSEELSLRFFSRWLDKTPFFGIIVDWAECQLATLRIRTINVRHNDFQRLPVSLVLLLLSCMITFCFVPPVTAQKRGDTKRATDEAKKVHDAVIALKRFTLAPGIRADVFAADPQVANPVSFCIDEKGRMFVCETYRQKQGVEDNRDHEDWVDDDLAAQTVEDRIAYYKKHLGKDVENYTKQEDRIRMLVDRDGNGRADVSYVFKGGFTGAAEGTGAGVLARKGTVYYTCIPRLWAFRDEDDDGRADKQLALHSGFGVRVAFRGHDLHGLCLGPDGRIYFSIGDRGYNVTTANGTLADPESGAVFRCEQDGTGLEVFATGLRNPQELAFDEYGNLFTGDNNSDSGDLARWVHLLEGGDCGWRMAFQYLGDRGPWNRLKLWEPWSKDQPAFVNPPVANVGDGPSGIAYYPGTGLGDFYIGNFFMCDFRGEASQSGIRTFKMRPKGATFELIDPETFLWNCLATDLAFGPDGAVYVSDWVEGWDGTGKGRIYRFTDDKARAEPEAKEVQSLLAEGFAKTPVEELAKLLEHKDYRIRLESQLELAIRGKVEPFQEVLADSDSQVARLHSTWGLGFIARRTRSNAPALRALLPGLRDVDPAIRAATASMVGDLRYKTAIKPLTNLLADQDAVVQYHAAIALGKIKAKRSADDMLDFAALIPDDDPALRHASVLGLLGTTSDDELVATKSHPEKTARLAALLALRRRASSKVAEFLDDEDPFIAREAALAINDEPIDAAMPDLAEKLSASLSDEGYIRRALNANFRLGKSANAERVARFAADKRYPDPMRNLALDMLRDWAEPSSRDTVLGMWRPIEKRSPEIAKDALKANLPSLLRAGLSVRTHAARLAGEFGIDDAGPMLTKMLDDATIDARERAGVLLALGNIKPQDLATTLDKSLKSSEARIRAAARILLVQTRRNDAYQVLEEAIVSGEPIEQRSALTLLANLGDEKSDALIQTNMQKLLDGEQEKHIQVETLASSQRRMVNPAIKKLVDAYNEKIASDPMAKYQVSLHGGDAVRGEKMFRERVALSCVRCHKVNGTGGEVGPDLTNVAKDKDRQYLLESIVQPSKAIAKGYESVVLFTDDGRTITGILKSEDEDRIFLMSDDERSFSIDKSTVEERETGQSAMPADLIDKISLFDLRDLIEYLATLKQ